MAERISQRALGNRPIRKDAIKALISVFVDPQPERFRRATIETCLASRGELKPHP